MTNITTPTVNTVMPMNTDAMTCSMIIYLVGVYRRPMADMEYRSCELAQYVLDPIPILGGKMVRHKCILIPDRRDRLHE